MPTPTKDPELAVLQQKEANLLDKLNKLNTGELNASIVKGDGRQELIIDKNERFLRGVRAAISARNAELAAQAPTPPAPAS